MRTDLAILVGILAFAFASMPVYALSGARRRPDPNAPPVKGSFVLGPFVRDWFYWFLRPVDRASLALGLGPLFFNLAGVAFGMLAGVLFAYGWMVAAGWAVLVGGVADILDGRIARARGMASRRGAFLDSSLDRFAEFAAFVGLAVWFRLDPLALVLVVTGLGGSLLVSYTRARGESVGVLCKLGVMQRAERLMLLGFAGIADPAVSAAVGRGAGDAVAGVLAETGAAAGGGVAAAAGAGAEPTGAVLVPALAIIAVGTVGTAIFRTVWIAKRLPARD